MKKQLIILSTAILGLTATAQVPNYVPTNGLVGWWPFNGNANDESGNGNNGTVNGATLTADRFGIANKAYSFDGVDDYFDVGINQMDSFSVSIWLKNISYSPTSIIWQHKNNCTRGGGFMMMQINGNIRFYTYNCGECSPGGCGNIVDQTNLYALNLNEWYHVLLTKTNLGQINLYINATQVFQFTNTINNLNFGIQPFSIGKWHDVPDLYYTNANKDDIGIWNRALNECEIQQLYNSASPNSTQTQTALDSYTWPVNGQTYTQSGTYTHTLTNAAGCDSIVTLDLTLSFTGIDEINSNGSKKLLKITDLNGKETPFRKNTVLLFIYEDGTVERVFVTE
jgi:hypothetical protein